MLVSERLITNATNVGGEVAADHTVERERVLSLECAECGEIVSISYAEKPIPKRAWDRFWAYHLTDFIIPFEHYAAHNNKEEETKYDVFLKGMAKGMWTICNFVEAELVQDE